MFENEIVQGPIKVLEAAASNNAYVEGSLARNPDTLAYLALRQLPIANLPIPPTYLITYLVLCMPWYRWWSDDADFVDGVVRWNNYYLEHPNSIWQLVLDIPPFLGNKSPERDERLKAGPYASFT